MGHSLWLAGRYRLCCFPYCHNDPRTCCLQLPHIRTTAMACNLNDDLTRWHGHIEYHNLEETPSPLGDAGRSSTCVSNSAVCEVANNADSSFPTGYSFLSSRFQSWRLARKRQMPMYGKLLSTRAAGLIMGSASALASSPQLSL
jgi:hypothetical protein